MTSSLIKVLAACAAGVLGCVAPAGAQDQAFPSRPLRLVVPYPPGGTIDTVARILSPRIAATLKQPVVVENRPGGGTIIGTDAVAHAAPDGYTMLMGSNSAFTIAPHLQAKLPYDTLKSFAPITMLLSLPNVVAVPANAPYKTLADLLAVARKEPGKLSYASFGNGTTAHLSGESLKASAGVDIQHVPYNGSGAEQTSIMRGDVAFGFDTVTNVLPRVRGGQMRALAVTSRRRATALPNVPTAAEAGVPNVDVTAWIGLFVPAGTPAAAQQQLGQAVAAAMADEEVKKRIADFGADVYPLGATEVRQLITEESTRFAGLIKRANIRVD